MSQSIVSQSLHPDRLRARLRAAGIHLGASAIVASVLLLLVTKLWYPSPLFDLAKGRNIFLLMIGCDVTLGPVMTLIIFNIRKPRRELVRDVAIIATVQVAAMIYGVSTLLAARPAYIVYNLGQFNVSLANEIVQGPDLDAPSAGAPWSGPKLVGARLPQQTEERNKLLSSALRGHGDVFQMPRYFVAYSDMQPDVASRARSADAMAGELGVEPSRVQAAVGSIAPAGAQVGVLPLLIREEIAIAVVGLPKGEFLGIAPLPPAN